MSMTIDITNAKRASALDAVLAAQDTDKLILVTATGTKTITKGDLLRVMDNSARRVPRDITDDLDNLPAAAAEQNLAKYGYAIGDYFTGPSGYTYWLADMDPYYGGFDQYCLVSTHHIGIFVDTKTASKWHETVSEVVNKGYAQSTLHGFLTGTALPKVKTDFTALFGSWADHLLAHGTYYTTAFGTWASQTGEYIHALTEIQIYGSTVWSRNEYQQGEGVNQLELFRKFKFNQLLGQGVWTWLRSLYQATSSAASACNANTGGLANNSSVTYEGRASGLILFN